MIELLVVLAALALLLAVAMPRYVQHVDRAREVALRENLHQLRLALDKFQGDHGRYPTTLEELVSRRYLRAVPVDPITERADTWRLLPPPGESGGSVYDLRSGAPGRAQDGTDYGSW